MLPRAWPELLVQRIGLITIAGNVGPLDPAPAQTVEALPDHRLGQPQAPVTGVGADLLDLSHSGSRVGEAHAGGHVRAIRGDDG